MFCATYQLPQSEVKINQQRNNLARVQMLHALAYRLLPNESHEGTALNGKSICSCNQNQFHHDACELANFAIVRLAVGRLSS